MGELFCGFMIGILLAVFIYAIGLYIYSSASSEVVQKLVEPITYVLCIIAVCLSVFFSATYTVNANKRWEMEYEIQKNLIEDSVENANLTGFERVELVKQANELNAKLVGKQFDCQKWYGFLIPDSVLELEPIAFK